MANYCTSCGSEYADGTPFCSNCGAKLIEDKPETSVEYTPVHNSEEIYPAADAPIPQPEPPAQNDPTPPAQQIPTTTPQPAPAPNKDPATKVVSTAAFWGLMLLFGLPIIGFIACIIMSFAPKNKNIRHMARAYLIWVLIGIIVFGLIAFAISLIVNAAIDFFQNTLGGVDGILSSFGEILISEAIEEISEIDIGQFFDGGEIDISTFFDGGEIDISKFFDGGEIDISQFINGEGVDISNIDASEFEEILGQLDSDDIASIIEYLQQYQSAA